jgi:hypothetical protein
MTRAIDTDYERKSVDRMIVRKLERKKRDLDEEAVRHVPDEDDEEPQELQIEEHEQACEG